MKHCVVSLLGEYLVKTDVIDGRGRERERQEHEQLDKNQEHVVKF